jgi:outer membrane protein
MKKLWMIAFAAFLIVACKGGGENAPAGVAAGVEGPKPPKKNPVVVVLDIERIIKESKMSHQLQSDLQSWADSTRSQLQSTAEEIHKAETDGKIPAKQLEGLKERLYQAQEQAKQEYQRRQDEAGEQMKKTFDPLIQTLAKENGWDIVLNKADQITIWTSDVLDQTDYVIHRLDQSVPVAATKP